mmetsp:Transcript_36774/g.75004  ORF Transcript_36774/g.75004 Transcript_36774/m.75004 type:complete len:151 (-) Transcript_36774:57-509(-)|eukprot:CAMPEP_0183309924 /NCGR_PEP_ID=MMETSP0160_2-20130417/27271_1 /TAXON_ID=2839 ORGANISM="Odontella Sinensis, Strain Grunow 1884" /NCGR_SAMPLE_ID=MMETSP0160_2 /ASSEMBLY_ACC=CAM_ASM_000250 /LENGTH=150 /DNA_ID=CAMNT_0025474033 /DNA_START=156 /DNA_END=608 /DNA_ORIENTATION=+
MTDSKWKKFFAVNSKPTSATFPELPDMITWLRMGLALLYGLSLGLRDTAGGVGVIFGLNVITFVPIIYISSVLDANTDTYKNLNFVGVPNALALMLLVWLYLFTMEHAEDEAALGAAVVQVVKTVVEGGEETLEGLGEEAAPPLPDEAEF